jgi:hypothetical protein
MPGGSLGATDIVPLECDRSHPKRIRHTPCAALRATTVQPTAHGVCRILGSHQRRFCTAIAMWRRRFGVAGVLQAVVC